MMVTCRYCPFYVPSQKTPVYGHCAGESPPRYVYGLNDSCPFKGDKDEIERQILARGFYGHDLRGLIYYGMSELGNMTRFYYSLEDLREFVRGSKLNYTLYVCFLDCDGHTFARATIPQGAEA